MVAEKAVAVALNPSVSRALALVTLIRDRVPGFRVVRVNPFTYEQVPVGSDGTLMPGWMPPARATVIPTRSEPAQAPPGSGQRRGFALLASDRAAERWLFRPVRAVCTPRFGAGFGGGGDGSGPNGGPRGSGAARTLSEIAKTNPWETPEGGEPAFTVADAQAKAQRDQLLASMPEGLHERLKIELLNQFEYAIADAEEWWYHEMDYHGEEYREPTFDEVFERSWWGAAQSFGYHMVEEYDLPIEVAEAWIRSYLPSFVRWARANNEMSGEPFDGGLVGAVDDFLSIMAEGYYEGAAEWRTREQIAELDAALQEWQAARVPVTEAEVALQVAVGGPRYPLERADQLSTVPTTMPMTVLLVPPRAEAATFGFRIGACRAGSSLVVSDVVPVVGDYRTILQFGDRSPADVFADVTSAAANRSVREFWRDVFDDLDATEAMDLVLSAVEGVSSRREAVVDHLPYRPWYRRLFARKRGGR